MTTKVEHAWAGVRGGVARETIEWDGVSRTRSEWAKALGVDRCTFSRRFRKWGACPKTFRIGKIADVQNTEAAKINRIRAIHDRADVTRQRKDLIAQAVQDCPEVWRGDDDACLDALTELHHLLGGLTLDECGILLGVSRERVRQVEAAALGELREHDCLRQRWEQIRCRVDFSDWLEQWADQESDDVS